MTLATCKWVTKRGVKAKSLNLEFVICSLHPAICLGFGILTRLIVRKYNNYSKPLCNILPRSRDVISKLSNFINTILAMFNFPKIFTVPSGED
jgi:hypothetical protein